MKIIVTFLFSTIIFYENKKGITNGIMLDVTVLFLSRLFYPHIGGVEKHIAKISKILQKKGYNILLATENDKENKLPSKETIDGIVIYRIPIGENIWFKKFIIWFWFLKHLFLIRKADIIHCHDVFFWYLPFRILFPYKKVFTTFHGYESFPISTRNIIQRKIAEKLSYGNICIGSFIEKWYHTKATFTLFGGVEARNKKGVFVSHPSALFIGRLDEQTNIREYAKAVIAIKKKIPSFIFHIIGSGKFFFEINKTNTVEAAKIHPEYDFLKYRFAFVSRYLSILEAMIAKRLVFAIFDNAIKKDYLVMTPFKDFIVIVSSVDELFDKVMYFLKHPKKEKEKIISAYQWAKKQTWENVVLTYMQLWHGRKNMTT
jgi:glycosyltransferase involved in cell wall biosynthesis